MRSMVAQDYGEVTYISGGLFVSSGQWKHPEYVLDDYELIICLQGSFMMNINDAIVEVKKGDGIFLSPRERHYGVGRSENVSFLWLHFMTALQMMEMDENTNWIFENIKGGDFFKGLLLEERFICGDIEEITLLVRQLLHYGQSGKVAHKICDLMMELILQKLSIDNVQKKLKLNGQNDYGSAIEKVCDYIRANLYRNLTVQMIAEFFGYNTEYFIRMFKNMKGTTPKRYICEMQIDRAKFLLTTSNEKIKEIAHQIGIDDEKVFLKRFKKSEGITPSQFRKTFTNIHYNSR